jgi:ATP-dependent protease HslVU (ClpYQ) peptidase subunit
MTCIVGITDGDKVYMGSDSAVSLGWITRQLADPKIFKIKDGNGKEYLIGAAGSPRLAQIVRHVFHIPVYSETLYSSTLKYLCSAFIPELRKSCIDLGMEGKDQSDGTSRSMGELLVGFNGQLFTIYSDFSVLSFVEDYTVIGSGSEIALGVLYATACVDPETRIRLCMQACDKFCSGVQLPYTMDWI